ANTYTRGRAVKERAKSRCTASTSAATELAITASSGRLIAVSSRRSAGPVIIANSMPPTTSIVRAGGVALADGSGVGEELREAVRRRWRRGSRPRPRTRPVARRARRRGPASAAEPARSTLAGPPKKLRERLDPRDAVPEEGGHRERDQRDGGRDVGILGDH